MNTNYLNKPWALITREERLFCSHLYHHIKDPKETKKFVKWLNEVKSPVKVESPLKGFTNQLALNEKDNWEAAFEVCFYRDFLKSRDIGVKGDRDLLIDIVGEKHVDNLIKRTFDLALFSSDTIVIIEAKAAEWLNSKQFDEFEEDANLIRLIFTHFKIKPLPKIKFIVLASSRYYNNSKTFTSKKGIGKIKLIDAQQNDKCKVDALISWEQLKKFNNDPAFDRAETC